MANVTSGNATVTNSLSVRQGANVDMGGNRIQNVGNGVNDSDAANMGQLRQVEKLANQQGAIAAAAVNIPIPHALTPGQTTIGVGLGNSGGQTAAAVGLASRITEDLVLKGSVGVSGSTTAVGIGLGYTFK